MNPEISRRIAVLRFPLVVSVVYIHAAGFLIARPRQDLDFATRAFFSLLMEGISRTAVPLFFVIAGFLFFKGFDANPFDLASYAAKLRNRAQTLLVPYLFWIVLTLAVVFAAGSLPGARSFVEGNNRSLIEGVRRTPFPSLLRAFGVGDVPIAYHLWFIRDLIVLVVASPIVYLGARFGGWALAGLLSVGWLFQPGPPWSLFVSVDALFCFYLGSVFALRNRSFFPPPSFALYGGVPCVLLVLADAAFPEGLGDVVHRLMIVCGGLCLLGLSAVVLNHKALEARLIALAPTTFFVFASHEPLVTILRKLSMRATGSHPGASILLYLVVPALVILICLGAYAGLGRFAPHLRRIVSGGR